MSPSCSRPTSCVELVEARDELSLARLHQRYQRVALLIVYELGFVPFERTGGELIFNLLADRCKWRTTIDHHHLGISEWVQVFGDEKLTTALLDRLDHRRPDPDNSRPVLPDAPQHIARPKIGCIRREVVPNEYRWQRPRRPGGGLV